MSGTNAASTRFEIYRDVDSNPKGRERIAVVDKNERIYIDSNYSKNVKLGEPVYYWVKFWNQGEKFNSGAASWRVGGLILE